MPDALNPHSTHEADVPGPPADDEVPPPPPSDLHDASITSHSIKFKIAATQDSAKPTSSSTPASPTKKTTTLQEQLVSSLSKSRTNIGLVVGPGIGGMGKSTAELVFAKFDTDKSGFIDKSEFQLLCRNLGYTVSRAELNFAVAKMDLNGSGKIELDEFKAWWSRPDRWAEMKLDEKDLEIRKQVSQVFLAWESEQKGVILRKDFDRFHEALVQKKFTTKDKAACLKDLDKHGDGSITFADYAEWLTRTGVLKVKVEA